MKANSVCAEKRAGTKWERICAELKADIESGRLKPGAAFYTVRELSRAFKVSDITSRRVFQELKEQSLISTDGRRGTTVTHCSSLRHKLFLCLRDESLGQDSRMTPSSRIYHETVMGLQDIPGENIQVMPVSLNFILSYPEMFKGQDILVNSEVFLQVRDERVLVDQTTLQRFRQQFNPVLIRGLDEIENISQVAVDYQAGIVAMLAYLLNCGYSRPAFIGGQTSSPWYRPRLQGFLDGLHAHGLNLQPELLKITSGKNPAEDHAAVAALLAGALKPDVIVCANDLRALNVLGYCRQQRIKVPEELAVTGFDNLHEGELCSPALTSMDPQIRKLARTAFELLKKRRAGNLREPFHHKIVPELIARESA